MHHLVSLHMKLYSTFPLSTQVYNLGKTINAGGTCNPGIDSSISYRGEGGEGAVMFLVASSASTTIKVAMNQLAHSICSI